MKIFYTLVLFLIISNNAYTDQRCKKQPNEMVGGYNKPARIKLEDGNNVYLTITFLYMQASEDGLNYALSNPSGAQLSPNNGGKFLGMDWEFKPAFRVGMGYIMEHDDWDVYAEYTRFYQTTADSSYAPSGGTLITLWLQSQNQGFAEKASAKWRLRMDILDVELARSCFISPGMIMRPFFGVRAMWLDQRYNVDYFNVTPSGSGPQSVQAFSKNVSDSWALGPRFGIDTNWLFGRGIRLFGDFSASLIYTSYKVSHKEGNLAGSLSPFVIRNTPNNLRPNLELSLGLGWGSYLKQNRYHIDIAVGYEFHMFWEQNEIDNLGNFTGFSFGGGGADLNLNGLGIRLRFDF